MATQPNSLKINGIENLSIRTLKNIKKYKYLIFME
jgi:hypothetical protein